MATSSSLPAPQKKSDEPLSIDGVSLVAGRPAARVVLQIEWDSKHFLKARLDRVIEAGTITPVEDGSGRTLPLCEHFSENLDALLIKWKRLDRRSTVKFAQAAIGAANEHAATAKRIFQAFVVSAPDPVYLVRAAELFTNNIRTISDLANRLLFSEAPKGGGPRIDRISLDRSIAGMVILRKLKDDDLAEMTELRDAEDEPVGYDSSSKGELSADLIGQALRINPRAVKTRLDAVFAQLRRINALRVE